MLPDALEQAAQKIFCELVDYQIEVCGNIFIVMRGLPGSGKSSISKRIQELFQQQNTQVVRVCTDEILEMCEGSYLWAGNKMRMYHSMARSLVFTAMDHKTPIVILDNTNIRVKEFAPYIEGAMQRHFGTRIFTIGDTDEFHIQQSMKYNTHNVPEDAIRRMATRFEH